MNVEYISIPTFPMQHLVRPVRRLSPPSFFARGKGELALVSNGCDECILLPNLKRCLAELNASTDVEDRLWAALLDRADHTLFNPKAILSQTDTGLIQHRLRRLEALFVSRRIPRGQELQISYPGSESSVQTT